ncbi:MAG: lytic transglycosylase [Candidatus Amulumruptor caecigallinarius]|uniref:Lytic transglycosylase domain-containing protein n=1 Tax=Candidatus Amulumruptor caecigallinarius TaxID=2109911 RepID=A0A4Q0U8U7_9BACT|nr:MAG: lytic transglycosylase [Candidatus Amulumruptor caecigallinarius]HJE39775.1 lytic transglycosylase domain-containing protein [Candidatus Amulumruptor caecigallinarius]
MKPTSIKTFVAAMAVTTMATATLFFPASASASSRDNDETRFANVVNPTLPRSVTFAGQKFDLDNSDYYERLDRELTAMTFTHGTTLLTLKRANRYMPVIVPILKANGVPEDLVYLCAIESNFNPLALSTAKAAGLWQFMPSTGREYGLEVNDYVDERYHPIKATEAATKYLKDAYARYGSWESVAASYNAGMGRITRELAAQGTDSAFDLWLPQETMRYPFRLLAMKIILEHPKEFGYRLRADQLYQPYDYYVVPVNSPVDSWADWAKEHGMTYLQLRTLNPWIRSSSLPNKSGKVYEVFVPKKKSLTRSNRNKDVYNHDWVVK